VKVTRARFIAFYRRLPSSTVPLVLIILAVFLGNFVFLLGLGYDDPITKTSSISQVLCHVSCGRWFIDPNVGYITQSLGHRAAMDLLHGHLPWWNYFEGLGQPLAGEMQAAALFPLTMLFALPSGLVWFHVSLEVIAGVSTYFLAKRLSIPVAFATVAGVLFALNGTFSWLGNSVLNPVAFLPMLLLGIEMIYDGARDRINRGWYVVAIAFALSLYAGFPEVAYVDGLFCAAWAVVRFFSLPTEVRLGAARRLGLGALVGGVLSLPILVPFYDFMKVANVGSHYTIVQSVQRLPLHATSMLFDPYVYGPIFFNPNVSTIWGGIGGYFSASVCALALLGLFGKSLRPLRFFLAIWTLVGMLGAFNFLHVRQLWNVIPLLKSAAFARYIMPSAEIALILLAVLGIMDFASSQRAKRLFNVTTLLALVVVILSALDARSLNRGVLLTDQKERILLIVLAAIPFLSILALVVIGRFSKAKIVPLLLALVLVGESLLLFVVPTTRAPKEITVDQSPITFLLQNQGQQRFLDFAVLYPNWGSQYGLNELSEVDLPFPTSFTRLLATQLYPGLTPLNQFTVKDGMVGIVAMENEVIQHFKAYEGASVKYLLMPKSVVILPGLTKLGVKQVFVDKFASIYEMPNPRSFFSTKSATCTVTSTDVDTALVNCASGGSVLTRTELSMAGWQAYVNGKLVTIRTSDGVYQSVPVPAGTSTVTYTFLPPHEKLAMLAGLLALLFFLGAWVLERYGVRRQ
jgi:hypothetical protein